jgi:hypothetical protein
LISSKPTTIVVDNNNDKDEIGFMQARKLESAGVGRPPAEDPRKIQIAYRVTQSMADAIDSEIETVRQPGLMISRNDMARILMAEALEARAEKRKRGKK